MIVLGIDTVTRMRGIAIIDASGIIFEKKTNISDLPSDILMASIEEGFKITSLSLKDIDGIAISLGPGSFTGIRVGIAVAKGISLSMDIPILTFSTLEVLAWNLPFSRHLICPLIDAKKGDVYTALFRSTEDGLIKRISPDMVISPDEMAEKINESSIFLGDGVSLYKDLISERLGNKAFFAQDNLFFTSSSILAKLGLRDLMKGRRSHDTVLPKYLRRPIVAPSLPLKGKGRIRP